MSHNEQMAFSHCLCPAIMCKHDVIHKTGSTQHMLKPPEEDQAMATGNTHQKFG